MILRNLKLGIKKTVLNNFHPDALEEYNRTTRYGGEKFKFRLFPRPFSTGKNNSVFTGKNDSVFGGEGAGGRCCPNLGQEWFWFGFGLWRGGCFGTRGLLFRRLWLVYSGEVG